MSRLPPIKPGVVWRAIEGRDESYVMVREPEKLAYFKFELWEGDLIELFDGTRDARQIVAAFRARRPEISIDEAWVYDYLENLRGLDLIEKTQEERFAVLTDRVRSARRRRFYDAQRSTLFQIEIPLFDPNRGFDRVMPWIRWAWSPWFVSLWLVAIAVLLGYLLHEWSIYWAGFTDLIDPRGKGLSWVAAILGLTVVVSIWHELGHGLTCKRYGGEVHSIGFMIYMFQPAFYCNIDDSYLFPHVRQRIWATLGGPYFELMMSVVAAAICVTTPAELAIHKVCLAVVFFTGLMAIAVNINPLVKFDGYYVLMDLVDVPNLREESFDHIGRWVKRHVFRLETEPKPTSRRRRRIFVLYGVLAGLYTATLLGVILVYVYRHFEGWFGAFGPLLVALIVGVLFRTRMAAGLRFLRHVWDDKRELLATRRGRLVAGGFGLVALLLVGAIPSATRIDAPFTVEPGRRAILRAPADGIVRRVVAAGGERVRRGAVVAELWSPEILESRDRAASARDRLARGASLLRGEGDIAAASELSGESEAAGRAAERLDGRLATLALTSPIDGVVSTWRLEDGRGRGVRVGERVAEGETVDQVWLELAVLESDLREIAPGRGVRIASRSYPGRTLRATVREVGAEARLPEGPQAPDLVRRMGRTRVLVEIDNPGGLLKSGMTGQAQVLGTRRTVAGKFAWRARRWLGTLVW